MGDSKFGCGYAGTHLAAVNSSNALVAAVADSNVTCIKLAPTAFVLTAPLSIDRTLAFVAEEGRATLDGNGSVQLITASSSAFFAVHNLELSNGRGFVSEALEPPPQNLAPNLAHSPQSYGAPRLSHTVLMVVQSTIKA